MILVLGLRDNVASTTLLYRIGNRRASASIQANIIMGNGGHSRSGLLLGVASSGLRLLLRSQTEGPANVEQSHMYDEGCVYVSQQI